LAPNHPFHPQARHKRAGLATMVIGLMLVSLGSAYFRTQIVQNEDFTLRSNNNRLRAIDIPAARGAVYDRNGLPIAETVTTYSLTLEALPLQETERVLDRIRGPLALSDSMVAALMKQRKSEPRKPLPVATDLGFDRVSWLEEHRTDLPGLQIDAIPLRR
jgi:penicillin-binding protein 2